MNIRYRLMRSPSGVCARLSAPCALLVLAGCVNAPRPAAPAAVPPPVDPPHVMVLLQGPIADGQAGSLAESLAVPLLLDRRVTVVDPATVQANRTRVQTLLLQDGDAQGALLASQQLGADVVISGKAEARRLRAQIGGSNLQSYMADVTLRAVCAADARLLATASDTATAIALEEATGTAKTLRLALGSTLDRLVPEMLKAWAALPQDLRTRRGGTPDGLAASVPEEAPGDGAPIMPPPPGYEPPVCAIWQISPQTGVNTNWMPVLTETLFASMQQSQWFRLVTRDDMAKLLSEHRLQTSELCESSTRAAEFGRILNAQKMVIGSASRLGYTYQVVLKLIDVETGEVEKVGQASGGGNIDVLIRLIRQAAADMLRPPAVPADTAGATSAL